MPVQLITNIDTHPLQYQWPSSSISESGLASFEIRELINQYSEESYALFGSKNNVMTEIYELTEECAVENWDGYGAARISDLTLQNTLLFIRLLPDGIALPEIAPEPDGSISLDWMPNRHRTFSLSIGTSNQLAYAWVDGSERGHGVARFNFQMIPKRIMKELENFR